MRSWIFKSFSVVIFLFSEIALAAACCGGGGTSALISGDQKFIFSSSMQSRNVLIDNIDNEGIWYRGNQHVRTQSFSANIQHLIGDRWQAGAYLQWLQKNFGSDSGSGLSDLLANLGYELNPEYEMSEAPRFYATTFVQLATGRSPQESQQIYNSFGDGFNKFGLGASAFKMWGKFDFSFSTRIMTSYSQTKSVGGQSALLRPGNSWITDFTASRSLGSQVVSMTVSQYNENAMTSSDPQIRKLPESYATASLGYSRPLSTTEMIGLSYANQTWLGNPKNTSLGESWAIVYTKSQLR